MGDLMLYLQGDTRGLHPISRKLCTTARALAEQKRIPARGVIFCDTLSPLLRQALEETGLIEVFAFTGCREFYPEQQGNCLKNLMGQTEIALFPATPEGRNLSSLTAALLHTGVTADCTALSFTEKGLLLQTRPAFSGTMMAEILTSNTQPQIASLRFGMAAPPVSRAAVLHILPLTKPETPAITLLADTPVLEKISSRIIVAVGGGLREKEDLALFEALADRLGGGLFCSRALVDRGWLPRSRQIGLSGQSVSPALLLTFGISGSVQFRAGLENVQTLVCVDRDRDSPLMGAADLPLQGDLYEVARAVLCHLI